MKEIIFMPAYRHYGDTKFDKSKFQPIRNKNVFGSTKPYGGLWCSLIGITESMTWLDWCRAEGFHVDRYENAYFDIGIKPEAELLVINSHARYLTLPKYRDPILGIQSLLDYEQLVEYGIDALYVDFDSDHASPELVNDFYGWDVSSLLVLNPDCVYAEE